jgi:hypothetical protein
MHEMQEEKASEVDQGRIPMGVQSQGGLNGSTDVRWGLHHHSGSHGGNYSRTVISGFYSAPMGDVGMTAKEAFEKYKHLDQNLSDRDLVPESFWGSILVDLWSAVKYEIQEKTDDR